MLFDDISFLHVYITGAIIFAGIGVGNSKQIHTILAMSLLWPMVIIGFVIIGAIEPFIEDDQ